MKKCRKGLVGKIKWIVSEIAEHLCSVYETEENSVEIGLRMVQTAGEKGAMYEYHMIQVPPTISVKAGQSGGAAAVYLQAIVDEFAVDGWEFYRIETIGILEKLGCGCLAFILRMRPSVRNLYVVVFRRPIT